MPDGEASIAMWTVYFSGALLMAAGAMAAADWLADHVGGRSAVRGLAIAVAAMAWPLVALGVVQLLVVAALFGSGSRAAMHARREVVNAR
ncbi:hypothetical protein B1R94_22890 [Mycolicibacterium litorale]|nr:hypothetical protein B1R94_22890 [Mycolicibacterium litorale]